MKMVYSPKWNPFVVMSYYGNAQQQVDLISQCSKPGTVNKRKSRICESCQKICIFYIKKFLMTV
jgi:hypothetical protein